MKTATRKVKPCVGLVPTRMSETDAIQLIETHSEHRREKIVEAFFAMRNVAAEDRPLILKWLKNGNLDQLELGQLIADYRHTLGVCYGTAK